MILLASFFLIAMSILNIICNKFDLIKFTQRKSLKLLIFNLFQNITKNSSDLILIILLYKDQIMHV